MGTRPDVLRVVSDVFTAAEIAQAARVPEAAVRALIAGGEAATIDGRLMAGPEALRAARSLRDGAGRPAAGRPVFGSVLLERGGGAEPRRVSVAFSAAGHVLVIVAVLGWFGVQPPRADSGGAAPVALTHLVFVAQPGPGGGGGGGGLRQPLPPPRAERRGRASVDSPVPPRAAPPRSRERRPLEHDPLPRVVAPLVPVPAGGRDVRGLLAARAPTPAGVPGALGGAGGGAGRGAGAGEGAGVGPGSDGGAGGGPYRPGSGIAPPRVLREVKPDYTEAARGEAVEGDVLLEVIVLADGSVGEVRVLRGLGFGLDERAVAAMRRWRFHPADRRGVPVSVFVEVAMTFRLL